PGVPGGRLEGRRGELPVGEPPQARPVEPQGRPGFPAGPESVGASSIKQVRNKKRKQDSVAFWRRHGGSVSGAATVDAVA
ncbi:MAG: hypothetical protein ACKPEY_14010, partial [Planctomycetota bacterium]